MYCNLGHTLSLAAAIKNTLKDVSAASLAPHAQNLQVQQERMLYLSIPTDSVIKKFLVKQLL